MYKYGFFRDIKDTLYKVVIITDYQQYNSNLGQGQGEEITLLANPISIEFEGQDDVFAPYRCSTMTVRFLQERFDESLNNSLGNNVFVTLQKEEGGKYKTMWQGFATPNAYNQPFINVVGDEFELECQDALSTLKYCYFEKQNTKNHLTVKDYIQLAFLQLNGLFKRCIYPTTPNNILEMCIPQENWLNEDDEPMSWLDILSEICKYLGFTLTSEGEDILLLDPHCDEYFAFSLESGEIQPITFIREEITLNKEDVSSNDCNISLLPSYNKIVLTASHYPIEKTQKSFDDEPTQHCTIERKDLNFKPEKWLDDTVLVEDGRESDDVQLWYIISNQKKKNESLHQLFIRYNHIKNKAYHFISHSKDGTNKRDLVNNEDFNKDIFFNYNACHPIEYYCNDTKNIDDLPKKISLKKGILYQTAFGKGDNKTLVGETKNKGGFIHWRPQNETNNDIIFSHLIGHVITPNNEKTYVNINFNFKHYYGSFFPCSEMKGNKYNGLQYRLRIGETLYYDERTDSWDTEKHNCTVYFDDSGNLIQEFENWKTSILLGETKGIKMTLPRNTNGMVTFELLRPYTGISEAIVSDGRIGNIEQYKYQYTRWTPPASLITDYEAKFINLDDDDSETQYENILSNNRFIEEITDEIKVTTYDGKAPNFSSPYVMVDNNKTRLVKNLSFGIYEATAEESIILKRTCQFKTPQLKMEITLNRNLGFNSIIKSSWFPDKAFIVTSYTLEPQQMNYTYSFIELKPLDDFEGVKKMSKPRKKKRNGDTIPTTDDSNQIEETLIGYDMKKPTNFTLNNNGEIIMTI